PIKRIWRGGEPLPEGRVLLRDVIAIETVKESVVIAAAQEHWLPSLPGRGHGDRRQCLKNDDFGPEAPPVAAKEDLTLGALDVDLEEIDGAQGMLLAQRLQSRDRHGHRLRALAELAP